MNYSNISSLEVLKKLKSKNEGLNTPEVKDRQKVYGKNKLLEKKKISSFVKFLYQFKDLMIIVLILSSILSAVISYINNESYIDSFIILAIVVLNAILGHIQELKADKSIEALKKMQITKVKVRRDNKVIIINSEDIVPGDILVLEAGDSVPADARIIYSASLKVDESALTGESVAVDKEDRIIKNEVPISEKVNMIYMGTNVVYGKCEAVVCLTGMETEFGKIAESLSEEEKEITPLEKKINDISKTLSLIIFIIIIIMFIIGIIKGIKLTEIIMLSIALSVAAIPEGLPAIITITLSLGMSELAKKKAIVRKMSSVETLGSTEIICSDKTGTITQNKMSVRELYFNKKVSTIKELEKDNILLQMMILNNDASYSKRTFIGDPTEIAMLEYTKKFYNIDKVQKSNKRIDELPFDSNRKMMTTIHKTKKGIYLYTKGSFDSVIDKCNYILEDNKVIKLTSAKKKELKKIEASESNKAYRLLAYAYKTLDKSYELDNIENDLIFVGMVALSDPPRKEVKEAIALCKSASITPIMITGDSLDTAKAIAKEIGILEEGKEAITGVELDKMSFNELKRNIEKYCVYARVSPMNKLDIVNAWKENGKIVAMTGDGVNDAPAIKAGNIGVGMGISGTEVSKSVSDIVLADDSFSSIVTAVKEGRRIFDNIRAALVYLLTGNIAEVIVVFVGILAGFSIFTPIQLLYMNLVTDSLPAISLAFEKEAEDIMRRKVRKNITSFFTPFLMARIGLSAILKTIAILLVYAVSFKLHGTDVAITMAFLTLTLCEMSYAFSCRNLKENVMNKNFFKNKVMNKSMIVLTIIQLLVFFTPIKTFFGIVDINFIQVLYCIFVVATIFIIDEISKKIISNNLKD